MWKSPCYTHASVLLSLTSFWLHWIISSYSLSEWHIESMRLSEWHIESMMPVSRTVASCWILCGMIRLPILLEWLFRYIIACNTHEICIAHSTAIHYIGHCLPIFLVVYIVYKNYTICIAVLALSCYTEHFVNKMSTCSLNDVHIFNCNLVLQTVFSTYCIKLFILLWNNMATCCLYRWQVHLSEPLTHTSCIVLCCFINWMSVE